MLATPRTRSPSPLTYRDLSAEEAAAFAAYMGDGTLTVECVSAWIEGCLGEPESDWPAVVSRPVCML
jgi:hypothetical protein